MPGEQVTLWEVLGVTDPLEDFNQRHCRTINSFSILFCAWNRSNPRQIVGDLVNYPHRHLGDYKPQSGRVYSVRQVLFSVR